MKWDDLAENLSRTRLFWLGLVVYLLAAAAIASVVESRNGKESRRGFLTWLYFIAACMTTVGSDIIPKSGWTRFLAVVSSFIGMILLGVLLWLVTKSF